MKKKLLAGLAAIGLLAGGGSATALAAGGAQAASPATVASGTVKVPSCGPLGPLVAKGTITHAQAIAIHEGFISYAASHWRQILGAVLGQQVKNHTITHAQAGAVAAAITAWVQKYQAHPSAQHGPCDMGHGQDMMGDSGS